MTTTNGSTETPILARCESIDTSNVVSSSNNADIDKLLNQQHIPQEHILNVTHHNFNKGSSYGGGGGDDAKHYRMIANVLSARVEALRKALGDKRRNYERECGYPDLDTQIDPEMFMQLYRRIAVATRVVQLMPFECWQVLPQVYEDDNPKVQTPFEKVLNTLGRQLTRGSFFKGDDPLTPLWAVCKDADELSRIGQYGVMVIGINDGKRLNEPVDEVIQFYEEQDAITDFSQPPTSSTSTTSSSSTSRGSGSKLRRLTEIRCFPQTLAYISQFENDQQSPRYGMPTMYSITFADYRRAQGGQGLRTEVRDVHWTRVIHIADEAPDSFVFGTPAQEPVLNNILACRVLYSCDPEMFYKGAFPGMAISTHPSLGSDVDFDKTATRREVENYQNSLQRMLLLDGLSATQLAPQVVDPRPHIETQIAAICIQKNCPVSIFLGNEAGQAASNQNNANWEEVKIARRNMHCSAHIVAPLIDRLIAMRILPQPQSYSAYWPSSRKTTPKERSAFSFQMTQALAQYVTSKSYRSMSRLDYLTRVFGLTEQEAEAVIENTPDFEKLMDDIDKREAELALMKSQGMTTGDGSSSKPSNPGAPNDKTNNGVSNRTPDPQETGRSHTDNRVK